MRILHLFLVSVLGLACSTSSLFGQLTEVVDDESPQLGGMLDVNGFAIGDGTRELLTFVEDGSAVNHIEIENEATGSGPIIRAVGADDNIALKLKAKGTKHIVFQDGVTASKQAQWDITNLSALRTITLPNQDINLTPGNSGSFNVLADTSPTLGGDLDTNGFHITFDDASGIEDDSNNSQLIFQKTASAVNYIEITNAATGIGPTISSAGETNIDLNLEADGTGTVNINDFVNMQLADSATNTVTDVLRLDHTGGTVAAGFGSAIVFDLEDAGGSEEQASIDVSLDVVTDGVEEASIIFRNNVAGTMQESMRIDGTSGNIGIGATAPSERLSVSDSVSVTSATPLSYLKETGVSPDEGNWGFAPDGSVFRLRTYDDSLSTAETVFSITRAGTLPNEITFAVDLLARDGTAAQPSYSFSSDTDTGLFFSGATPPGLHYARDGEDQGEVWENHIVVETETGDITPYHVGRTQATRKAALEAAIAALTDDDTIIIPKGVYVITDTTVDKDRLTWIQYGKIENDDSDVGSLITFTGSNNFIYGMHIEVTSTATSGTGNAFVLSITAENNFVANFRCDGTPDADAAAVKPSNSYVDSGTSNVVNGFTSNKQGGSVRLDGTKFVFTNFIIDDFTGNHAIASNASTRGQSGFVGNGSITFRERGANVDQGFINMSVMQEATGHAGKFVFRNIDLFRPAPLNTSGNAMLKIGNTDEIVCDNVNLYSGDWLSGGSLQIVIHQDFETRTDINAITNANPGVVTTGVEHNFVTGERIRMFEVEGMTEVNDVAYRITKLSDTTFSLHDESGANVDTTNFGTFSIGADDNSVTEATTINSLIFRNCHLRCVVMKTFRAPVNHFEFNNCTLEFPDTGNENYWWNGPRAPNLVVTNCRTLGANNVLKFFKFSGEKDPDRIVLEDFVYDGEQADTIFSLVDETDVSKWTIRNLTNPKSAKIVANTTANTLLTALGNGTREYVPRETELRSDTGVTLHLNTGETEVEGGDTVGRIDFRAPVEASGGDAVLRAASIFAKADDTFSGTVNDTDLIFATGLSESATEKMRITSSGDVLVVGEVGVGVGTATSKLHVLEDASSTSSILSVVRIGRSTSGVPQPGIGARLLFDLEDAAGTVDEVGSIEVVATDVTADAMETDMVLNVEQGGSKTEVMRLVGSRGQVGIGTTSPSAEVDVVGTLEINDDLDFVRGDTSQIHSIGTVTFDFTQGTHDTTNHSIASRDASWNLADDLRINTFGALYINLDSNDNNTQTANFQVGRHGQSSTIPDWFFTIDGETGDVGIGTTSPDAKLELVEDDSSTNTVLDVLQIARTSSSTAADGIGARVLFQLEEDDGSVTDAASIEVSYTDNTVDAVDSDIVFNVEQNDQKNELLTLDGSELNVGVGDATPTSTLEVGGSVAAKHNVESGNETLGDASVYVFSGTSAATWTLPSVASTVNRMYWIKNRGSAAVTLQRAGSDELYDSSAVTSISVNAGEATMVSNDGTYWIVH